MHEDKVTTLDNGKQLLECVYDTVEQFAEAAQRRDTEFLGGRWDDYYEFRHVHRASQAVELAATGWEADLTQTIEVAEAAVEKVEKEQELLTFEAHFDVCGAVVDVGRYLSGEPECMVDMRLAPIVKAGRVITLCASIARMGDISTDTVIRRGQVVVALALALSRLGYAIEIWADHTSKSPGLNSRLQRNRVCVKSTDDVLDPARVLFMLAHPAAQRVLSFAVRHGMPASWRKAFGIPGGQGTSQDPIEDMPEGTIYLPCVRSNHEHGTTDEQLLGYLRQLGLVVSD